MKIITKDSTKVEQINNVKDIILNELNIKELSFDSDFENWVNYECKPNYPTLGPKLGNKIGAFAKNLSKLNQKPLIYYSIKQSLKCKLIQRTIVSTDNKLIAKTAKKYGAEVAFLSSIVLLQVFLTHSQLKRFFEKKYFLS